MPHRTLNMMHRSGNFGELACEPGDNLDQHQRIDWRPRARPNNEITRTASSRSTERRKDNIASSCPDSIRHFAAAIPLHSL